MSDQPLGSHEKTTPEGEHVETNSVTTEHAVTNTETVQPAGETVQINLFSDDVNHSFYVPAFRLQEDAVPGITTTLRATPDRLGTYPVICTQLCGYGHSTMRTTLHVVTAAKFSTWLAEHGYSGPTAQAASVHPTSAKSLTAPKEGTP